MRLLFTVMPLFAAAIACCLALAVFGIEIVNPQNTAWIQGDMITGQFGWHQYLHDPAHIYPLVTDRASYPLEINLAMFDNLPFLQILLKLFAPALPDNFQYMGPAFVIGVALQTLTAWALLREATVGMSVQDRQSIAYNISLFVGALLYGTAPILLTRFYYTHAPLTQQWPLLLALLIYLQSFRMAFWPVIRNFSLLAFFAAGLNPYVMMMCLIIFGGYIVKCLMERSLRIPQYAFLMLPFYSGGAGLLAAGYLDLNKLGFIQANDFGTYSANFFSPIDASPKTLGSQFLGDIAQGKMQYEGYGYLGLGVIFLIAASIVISVQARWRSNVPSTWSNRVWPLLAVIVVAYVWAMSNIMLFGAYGIEVPLPDIVLKALQPLRSAGRFIWIVDYTAILLAIASLIILLKPRQAAMLLAIAGIVQVADLAQPLAEMHHRFEIRALSAGVVEQFEDKAYYDLGRAHDSLIVIPAWQCLGWKFRKPPYPKNYFIRFSNLAMTNNLRTNSFYGGRTPIEQIFYHCDIAPEKLMQAGKADRRSVYIFTHPYFAKFGALISRSHGCDFADTMFVCRADRPVGLTARARQALTLPAPILLNPATPYQP